MVLPKVLRIGTEPSIMLLQSELLNHTAMPAHELNRYLHCTIFEGGELAESLARQAEWLTLLRLSSRFEFYRGQISLAPFRRQ